MARSVYCSNSFHQLHHRARFLSAQSRKLGTANRVPWLTPPAAALQGTHCSDAATMVCSQREMLNAEWNLQPVELEESQRRVIKVIKAWKTSPMEEIEKIEFVTLTRRQMRGDTV